MLKLITFFIALLLTSLNIQAQTLRVTLQLPQSHSLGQNWLDFKRIIEKKSNGELSLQLFHSAKLFKDNQVAEAVSSGAIEAGSAFLGRFSDLVPAVDVINLPFFFKDAKTLAQATSPKSRMRQYIDQEILSKRGTRVLWWQAYDRNIYLSKSTPIRLPSDIKGKRVRTYGKLINWTVEALGGVPTIISGSNQFLAYQEGTVDVGMTGASAVKTRKLYEVMNYLTPSFDSAIEFVAIINNNFFERLSTKHQKIILDAARIVEIRLRREVFLQEKTNVEAIRSKINLVSLTDEERQAWKIATKDVIKRFVEEVGDSTKFVIDAATPYR